MTDKAMVEKIYDYLRRQGVASKVSDDEIIFDGVINVPAMLALLSAVPDGWRKAVRDLVEQAMHCTVGFAIRQVDITEAMKNLREEAEKVDAMLAAAAPQLAPQPVAVKPLEDTVFCPCIQFEQDEESPEGYPHIHCGICRGSGEVKFEAVEALAVEMLKIANEVGEVGDPFAAWESIRPMLDTPPADLREDNKRLKRAYQGAQDNYQEAVEESERLRAWGLDIQKGYIEAKARVKALEEAANNVISSASDTYRKRNGKIATLEDDSGEKSWIVSYEAFEDLRAALKGGEA